MFESETWFMNDSNSALILNRICIEYRRTFASKSIFNPRSWRENKSFLALDNISFSLHEGDRVGIIGPNGAGKTTLLRVIAGIFEPSSGSILRVGSVHHLLDSGFGLEPSLSGRDNACTYAVLHGLGKGSMAVFVNSAKEFSGLEDFFERPVREYSTGMLTRLVFALATGFQPDILVMDEILGAGDAEFQTRASERINSVMSGSSIVVIASHSIETIQNTCNRAILLEDGRLIIDSTCQNVIDRYLDTKAT